MKKLLLSGTALFLAMNFANAQGWSATGGHDDFSGTDNIVNGPNNEGLYWFETTGGTTLKLTRPGDNTMDVEETNAGGCNDNGACYPLFGVNFGMIGTDKVTMDLSANANIVINIENQVNIPTFVTVTLEDANGKSATFEPNVSDVLTTTAWTDPGVQPRKSLNGFTFDADDQKVITLDLTNGGTYVGGLSRMTTIPQCTFGPFHCPDTDYEIDPSKITAILFSVNFGKDDIFVSEGDDDYTKDTFIPGASISSYTGGFTIRDFKVGNFVITANQNATEDNNKLSIYPNPAKDILHVSYQASSSADITLTDMIGNKVLSTTANAGSTVADLNTSGLKSGVYILTVSTENGKTSRRVSIQ